MPKSKRTTYIAKKKRKIVRELLINKNIDCKTIKKNLTNEFGSAVSNKTIAEIRRDIIKKENIQKTNVKENISDLQNSVKELAKQLRDNGYIGLRINVSNKSASIYVVRAYRTKKIVLFDKENT